MNDVPQGTYLEPRRRPRLRCLALMTTGILAVGVAVAGCGSGSSTPGVPTGSTSTSTAGSSDGNGRDAAELLAYASCVRLHGVPNFPDPNGGGEIPKEGVIRAAGGVSASQPQAA